MLHKGMLSTKAGKIMEIAVSCRSHAIFTVLLKQRATTPSKVVGQGAPVQRRHRHEQDAPRPRQCDQRAHRLAMRTKWLQHSLGDTARRSCSFAFTLAPQHQPNPSTSSSVRRTCNKVVINHTNDANDARPTLMTTTESQLRVQVERRLLERDALQAEQLVQFQNSNDPQAQREADGTTAHRRPRRFHTRCDVPFYMEMPSASRKPWTIWLWELAYHT
ncbi:hypothetical protein H310_13313 [Aphanomyces invadans]|uniref:Uncharacterized protein n=1 Tax=Aphanomyces invadans TaxID=157072 RepID=A0A024TFT6_9STRA|nr:hypothetical protein H310_13313 [Aphanomyces invadans]ETV92436.1 hypothetical protein H310_13313 [Aphanomyces invadans]|eukprot:XP_008878987.1 hypothetical protein H310_13313 [Aphanomyces invadans]